MSPHFRKPHARRRSTEGEIRMNPRTISAFALCGGLLAAAAAVPSAQAGNVAWGVSVGVPGFSVSAGQPGYYGRVGYVAPYRPYFAPGYYGPAYGAPVVVPADPYAYVAPAPVIYAPRPVVYAHRPYYRHWSY
jgi:hypothetical protein